MTSPRCPVSPAVGSAGTSLTCKAMLWRKAVRFALCISLLKVQVTTGRGSQDGKLCSKAFGFNESVGPKDRSNQELLFCTEHHGRTCCEKNHTREVLLQYSAFAHERSARCAQMSRIALCSVCDGDVGIGRKAQVNSILLCPSFCKRWYEACLNDFFAPKGSGEGVRPCGPGSVVCSPLGEAVENALAFCTTIGDFTVADGEDDEPDGDDGTPCFDGVPAARARGKGPRSAWVRPGSEPPSSLSAWLQWWSQVWRRPWLSYRLRSQLVRVSDTLSSWAPTMIVTTVGVLLVSFLLLGD